MTIIKIVTDNEWKGKYELLEQKYLEDNFPIWSLGDNLQTGEVGQVGKDSFFKTKRKQITANNLEFKNLNLYEQMKGVYKIFPEEFVQNYGLCVNVLKQGVEFLKNSSLPTMTAITGNRESDYQMLLDLFEKEITGEKLDYMNLLLETGKFEMIFQPETRQIEGTSILLIPYDKEMDQTQHDYESNIERLYEAKGERITLLTHENPCPEKFGSDRKAVMQESIDTYIECVKRINSDVKLFSGHIDISGNPIEYNGIIVQPISGTEALHYNTINGDYTITGLR